MSLVEAFDFQGQSLWGVEALILQQYNIISYNILYYIALYYIILQYNII